MSKAVHWFSPSLCGCELKITGDFADPVGGVSYAHPTPYTITDIEIINVYNEHKRFSEYMALDENDFFDDDQQYRGYLKYPIKDPTPAECLYTYLYTHSGQIHRMGCGCCAYVSTKRNARGEHIEGSIKYHDYHPLHTKHCKRHHNDVGHEQALEECKWLERS